MLGLRRIQLDDILSYGTETSVEQMDALVLHSRTEEENEQYSRLEIQFSN